MALEDLVAGFARDIELATQRRHLLAIKQSRNKSQPLIRFGTILPRHEVVRGLFGQVMQQAKEAQLLSAEHFSVDGTLIPSWASHTSFVPKDGPPPSSGSYSSPEVDFKPLCRTADHGGGRIDWRTAPACAWHREIPANHAQAEPPTSDSCVRLRCLIRINSSPFITPLK